MSCSAMSLVWQYGPDVPVQRLVLLYLADQVGDEWGHTAFNHENVAQHSCITVGELDEVLQALMRDGWLSAVTHSEGTHRVNLEWLGRRRLEAETQGKAVA